MLRGWSWGAVLVCLLAWVSPARAGADEVAVVVGRADADASGNWPVLLWVLDGDNSHVVVRAPRSQLATLRGQAWERVDAEPLMHLERYGAPRLVRRWGYDPCPLGLQWERRLHIKSDGGLAEQVAVEHPSCGVASCGQEAWRMALPTGSGLTLPLAQLMPFLASSSEEWLVVYVVSPAEALALEGLPQLRVPEALGDFRRHMPPILPEASAVQFPAIHAAALAHLAASQGLAQASLLMRSDSLSTVEPLRFARNWDGTPEQRRALGLDGANVQRHRIVRLLLRLNPANRPAALKLKVLPRGSGESFMRWEVVVPRPGTADSCRSEIEAVDCEAACAGRIRELRQSYVSRYGPKGDASATPTADLMSACVPACRQQMRDLGASVARNFEAEARGRETVWRWLEYLTGQPASNWRDR